MIFKNEIKRGYLQTKESLKFNFIVASEFLDYIEQLNGKGFHVGTHKNLHLYFKDNFLFYFSKMSSKIVQFASKPNGVIKKQTFNHSDLFFNLLIKELKQNHINYNNDIEVDNSKGFKITVSQSKDSVRFFELVKNTLVEIEKKENLIEFSNQVAQVTEDLNFFDSEKDSSLIEGIKKTIKTTYYERNSKARKECLKYWGFKCVVCGFDFERVYGMIGEKYIHVHHLIPISEIKQEYEIDPIKDLRPVCANCHAMIHRKKGLIMIEQLKEIVERNRKNIC